MFKINGNTLAKEILDNAATTIAAIQQKNQQLPQLDILLVESDQASEVYANMIVKKCQRIHMECQLHKMPAQTSTEELLKEIDVLNNSPACHGIIVQFPLPKHIDSEQVRAAICEDKDVDSAGYKNIGKFFSGLDCFHPCTPESMLLLLKSLNLNLKGKKAVVVGRSLVVGKPIAELLVQEDCTVTVCHSKTEDLAKELRTADIVMAAVGKAHLIDKTMLKAGAVVIDAGINVIDGDLYGDVNPEGLDDYLQAISPVPGGVGPVTIAVLINNVIKSYKRVEN